MEVCVSIWRCVLVYGGGVVVLGYIGACGGYLPCFLDTPSIRSDSNQLDRSH